MSPTVKFLIGLTAALAAGWIGHGPAGLGAAFVYSLDAQAQAKLAEANLPAVHVRFERSPLSREAIMSGQADEFQREGQGQYPGLNDRMKAIPGVSGVRWENE